MKKMSISAPIRGFALVTLLVSGTLIATSGISETNAKPEGSEILVSALKKNLPNLPIEGVHETPVEGMFGIELAGGQILYGSKDGRFFIAGDMYEIGQGITNLAEDRRALKRRAIIDEVPQEDLVVFSPSGDKKTHVTVFTDVDCGYCRKLHQEMADLNALGIEVRYMAYPRQGLDTPTYDKIVSAWCAKNPNEAITALKAGRDIPHATCDNPVARQFEIGQLVGVTGTPAIVTENGKLLPGYLPAAELAARIGLE